MLSDSSALLCTAQGDICLLDDSDRTQRLERVARVDFGILCVVADHTYGLIWIGGRRGTIRSMHLDTLIKPMVPAFPPVTASRLPSNSSEMPPSILAIGLMRGWVITVDSSRIIEVGEAVQTERNSRMGPDSKRLPAHESAVVGVSSLLPKSSVDGPDFLTFSAKGTVLFWLLDGTCTGSKKIPLDQPVCSNGGDTNDLKIVVPLGSDQHLLSGDKLGCLR